MLKINILRWKKPQSMPIAVEPEEDIIRIAFIGIGKMGMSHLSILGGYQKDVKIVGVCDSSSLVLNSLKQLTEFHVFDDYKEMLEKVNPHAVIISTPSQTHFEIAKFCLKKRLHIFIEKPFCLSFSEANELTELAQEKKVVNQVGYHNRFISTFNAAKTWIEQGVIGHVYHIVGEANGPAVLKESKSWRTTNSAGGGCLLDYGSHVLNLMNFYAGSTTKVLGAFSKPIYSTLVEDFVNALLSFENNISGSLFLNWSDETFRRMTTVITLLGKKGKMIVDSQEVKVYLNYESGKNELKKGWNTRHITDFPIDVEFFVRGEEYSAQLEHFISCIREKSLVNRNSFFEAAKTLKTMDEIKANFEA
jgi:predicted dehydrogenase